MEGKFPGVNFPGSNFLGDNLLGGNLPEGNFPGGSFPGVFSLKTIQKKSSRGLSDCNWTRTQNHLVRKRTLNHLAKL